MGTTIKGQYERSPGVFEQIGVGNNYLGPWRTFFLSGPMSGLPDYGFAAFAAAAENLRSRGHVVFSPPEHDIQSELDPSEHFSTNGAMRWDIKKILKSDAVVVLDGWRDSEGSGLETAVAWGVGIPVLSYPDLWPVKEEPIGHAAHRLVSGPRQNIYSSPHIDFSRTAKIWEGIFGIPITPEQVGLAQIGVKISRLCASPGHRDSLIDVAGYAETLDEIRDWREGNVGIT